MSRTKVVCHRGACRTAPENTIAAGHIARQQGADIVELDVRQSRDGILYVLHDTTVDRTTDGKGLIAELHSTEIDRLDAGLWFGPEFAGEPVPQLDEFFETLKDELGFYVEVKQADAKTVAATIQKAGISENCFTYSEIGEMRKALQGTAPWLKQMVNYRDVSNISEVNPVHHAQIIEFNASDVTPDALEQAQAAHLEIMIYTNQPDEDAFRLALTHKVDYINLDHPELFTQVRTEYQNRLDLPPPIY